MNEREPLDSRLAALPPREVARDVAKRTRRRALARLTFERENRDRPWLGVLVHTWSRVGVPMTLASVIGIYMSWAIEFVGAFYR